jgi:hypothetical protein
VNNVNLTLTQVRGVPFLRGLPLHFAFLWVLLLLAGAEGEWGHVVETLVAPALSATVVLELLITSQVSSALLLYTDFYCIIIVTAVVTLTSSAYVLNAIQ